MQPAPVRELYLEQRWTRFDFVTNSADIDPLQSHARAAAACKILANAPAVALSDGQVALAPPRGPIGALALFRAVEVEKLIVGRKGMSRLRLRRRLRDGFEGGSILVKGLCQGVRDKERVQQQTHCEHEHSNLGAQHPDTMLLLRVSLSACFFSRGYRCANKKIIRSRKRACGERSQSKQALHGRFRSISSGRVTHSDLTLIRSGAQPIHEI